MKNKAIEDMVRTQYNIDPNEEVIAEFIDKVDTSWKFRVFWFDCTDLNEVWISIVYSEVNVRKLKVDMN